MTPATRARRAWVAGTFYPAAAEDLAASVDSLLAGAAAPPTAARPAALVVPHAGHACSGPTAAEAYARVEPPVSTVAVVGPAHFARLRGLAVPSDGIWRTPLGDVPVDDALARCLAAAGLAVRDDRPHRREHCVEVQLPFLQRILGDGWTCLPVVVGEAMPDTVADCLDELARAPGVLLVATSDLSHYHDRDTAERLDRRTTQAMLDRDVDGIGDGDACGAVVLRGLLAWARRHRLAVELLDRRTSADTCGDPARVVGYASFALAGSS